MSKDEKSIVLGRNQHRKLVRIDGLAATNIAVFQNANDALGVIYNQYIAFSQCIRLKVKEITVTYSTEVRA